ncbi:MAG: insulinase family protein [Chlorobi bacterium]|nr:insulinase family protein [Chlorobiota bacterium]
MLKIKNLLILVLVLFFSNCTINKEKYRVEKLVDKNGYSYETVANDPLKARIYTLENGMKVYLTVNKDEPRIQTFIAVKAGSTYDPAETTGLAHYLEHMMFKGNSKIGSLNWEEESKLLEQISDLYEQHKNTDNEEAKKQIYKKIDSISQLAAKYVVANEYDKMASVIGAKGTNAHTTFERTVYMNDIPSNEIGRWLELESTRFSELTLRLFHTELEAVYEEFNMGQDNDGRKVYRELLSGLFKKHPYGTQTTIGKAEHLKNPSMVNIHNYWDTYYVPNNMALCLSGDLDFEKTILLADKTFGNLKSQVVPKKENPVEDSIKEPVIKDVYGPDAENVTIGYRFNGDNSEDNKYVTLIDAMLSNSQAGLIDLDLVQQQKVLSAGSYSSFMRDYGFHVMYANPREGQSLEEVKDLLLEEIEKIKNGDFDDWLISAVIKDFKLRMIQQRESNFRAYEFVMAFTNGAKWINYVKFIDDMSKLTKEQVIAFAKAHYKNNYVVVYKHTGKDTTIVKVEKPEITPPEINRKDQSEFYKRFVAETSDTLAPVFVDFKKEIQTSELGNIEFNYMKNNSNELFYVDYILDMGKDNMALLPIAVNYLPYLGTDKYSPSDLQKEFFKLGLKMGVNSGDNRTYIYISGLDESFEKGIELFEHVLANVKPDQKAYDDYIDGLLKERSDAKKNKNVILWRGLMNYGMFGKNSSFTNILPEEELRKTTPEQLTNILKELYNYKHRVFYYGQRDPEMVKTVLNNYHKTPDALQEYPEKANYTEQETNKNKVYFVNYDMVQTMIVMLAKDVPFDATLIPEARLFGEFYGSGLSSIVFQEIRESKALAYSAFSSFRIPRLKERSNYLYGFVATQTDKMKMASSALLNLLNEMPEAEKQFESAKDAIKKKIETERIIKDNIFWTYQRNLDKGIDYDIRKDVYERMQTETLEQFNQFFNKHIKGHKYTYLVVGNKDLVNWKDLKTMGEVEELSLEDIFNY